MSLQFAKDESVVTVQRRFCTKYQRRAPTDKTIHSWYNIFKATGCLWDAKRTGRPGPSAGSVNRVRETFAGAQGNLPVGICRYRSQLCGVFYANVFM